MFSKLSIKSTLIVFLFLFSIASIRTILLPAPTQAFSLWGWVLGDSDEDKDKEDEKKEEEKAKKEAEKEREREKNRKKKKRKSKRKINQRQEKLLFQKMELEQL